MADKLDREIVVQTIRGYEEADRISKEIRFNRLRERSIAESIHIFRKLYQAWERTGKMMGGDSVKLRQLRSDEAVSIRVRMNRAIERMNAQ